MRRSGSFLAQTRRRRPAAWALLKLAAARGIVRIDEDRDRITRLVALHPGAADVLELVVAGSRRDASRS